MKKISVYLRNGKINPSNYYRITQIFDAIDIKYREVSSTPDKLYSESLNSSSKTKRMISKMILTVVININTVRNLTYDYFHRTEILVVQREICPRYMPVICYAMLKACLKNGTKLIWDFDDDIFLDREISKREGRLLIQNAHKIITTSQYLIRKLPEAKQNNCIILPTTDGEINYLYNSSIFKKRMQIYKTEIHMVWVGTSVNVSNLHLVGKELDYAAKVLLEKYHKSLILDYVSGHECDLNFEYLQVNFIRWNRENTIKAILNAHIGIMPLPHSEYSLGKGGFKLIQYISAGLPVVASGLGYNKAFEGKKIGYVLHDENSYNEWGDCIIKLSTDSQLYSKCGQNAVLLWEKDYSIEMVAETWKHILNGC